MEYTVTKFPLIVTSETEISPAVDALYGPWSSNEEFYNLTHLTSDKLPDGLKIGIFKNGELKEYYWNGSLFVKLVTNSESTPSSEVSNEIYYSTSYNPSYSDNVGFVETLDMEDWNLTIPSNYSPDKSLWIALKLTNGYNVYKIENGVTSGISGGTNIITLVIGKDIKILKNLLGQYSIADATDSILINNYGSNGLLPFNKNLDTVSILENKFIEITLGPTVTSNGSIEFKIKLKENFKSEYENLLYKSDISIPLYVTYADLYTITSLLTLNVRDINYTFTIKPTDYYIIQTDTGIQEIGIDIDTINLDTGELDSYKGNIEFTLRHGGEYDNLEVKQNSDSQYVINGNTKIKGGLLKDFNFNHGDVITCRVSDDKTQTVQSFILIKLSALVSQASEKYAISLTNPTPYIPSSLKGVVLNDILKNRVKCSFDAVLNGDNIKDRCQISDIILSDNEAAELNHSEGSNEFTFNKINSDFIATIKIKDSWENYEFSKTYSVSFFEGIDYYFINPGSPILNVFNSDIITDIPVNIYHQENDSISQLETIPENYKLYYTYNDESNEITGNKISLNNVSDKSTIYFKLVDGKNQTISTCSVMINIIKQNIKVIPSIICLDDNIPENLYENKIESSLTKVYDENGNSVTDFIIDVNNTPFEAEITEEGYFLKLKSKEELKAGSYLDLDSTDLFKLGSNYIITIKRDELPIGSQIVSITNSSKVGDLFNFNMSPSIINVDQDGNVLDTNFTLNIFKNSTKVESYEEERYSYSINNGSLIELSEVDQQINTPSFNNNNFISLYKSVEKDSGNSDLKLLGMIPIVYVKLGEKGEQGEQGEKGEDGVKGENGDPGYTYRFRGDWKEEEYYYHGKEIEGDVSYLDVVRISHEDNYHYYECVETNINTPPQDSTKWKLFDNYDLLLTHTLLVKDSEGNITGGFTGGTVDSQDETVIWSGGQSENAPFRVTNSGNVYANNFIGSGYFSQSEVLHVIEKSPTLSLTDNPSNIFIYNQGSMKLYLTKYIRKYNDKDNNSRNIEFDKPEIELIRLLNKSFDIYFPLNLMLSFDIDGYQINTNLNCHHIKISLTRDNSVDIRTHYVPLDGRTNYYIKIEEFESTIDEFKIELTKNSNNYLIDNVSGKDLREDYILIPSNSLIKFKFPVKEEEHSLITTELTISLKDGDNDVEYTQGGYLSSTLDDTNNEFYIYNNYKKSEVILMYVKIDANFYQLFTNPFISIHTLY